ncbi:MAG: RNA polymerase sigma factor [Bacteroidetes bacterium]|nr:MAG: RNA polymerase sigma factor [Bacteroidota bacterium]
MGQDSITFTELYRRYSADVHRFAYWLSGDPDEAKDIVSESFVRVWTSDAPIREGTVKAYLFTIARNLYLRRSVHTRRFTGISEENAGSTQRTERETEARSELEQTLAAMQSLSEIDRTVLTLRSFDELSYDEIAAVTGLTVAAIKVKVFRARAALEAKRAQF